MDMNETTMQPKENVVAGLIGALLFSLAGGVLWFLLYQVGFLAGISGAVGVVCAIKGYEIFAKKESLKGVVIAIVAAVLVMVLAWYLCLSLDVYQAYQDWYEAGEVDFTLTFGESVMNAYLFLFDSEIALAYFKDLGIGLLLCGVGAFQSVVNATKRVKLAKQAAAQPATAFEPEMPPQTDIPSAPSDDEQA